MSSSSISVRCYNLKQVNRIPIITCCLRSDQETVLHRSMLRNKLQKLFIRVPRWHVGHTQEAVIGAEGDSYNIVFQFCVTELFHNFLQKSPIIKGNSSCNFRKKNYVSHEMQYLALLH